MKKGTLFFFFFFWKVLFFFKACFVLVWLYILERTSFFKKNPQPRICLLILEREEEGGRERKEDINVREDQGSIVSHIHPNWKSNPQPRYDPWLGIQPATVWCTRQMLQLTGHPARSLPIILPSKLNCLNFSGWCKLWISLSKLM